MEPSGILSERSLTAATLPKALVTFRSWIAFIEAPARTRQNPLLTYLQTQSIEHCKGSGVARSLREIILSHEDPVTGRRVAHSDSGSPCSISDYAFSHYNCAY